MMRNSSQKKKSNINKRYRFQSWIRRAKSLIKKIRMNKKTMKMTLKAHKII